MFSTCALHQQIKKEYGSNVVPSFPPKKIFTLTPAEVEQRREQLEKYMQAGKLSSPTFCYFRLKLNDNDADAILYLSKIQIMFSIIHIFWILRLWQVMLLKKEVFYSINVTFLVYTNHKSQFICWESSRDSLFMFFKEGKQTDLSTVWADTLTHKISGQRYFGTTNKD